MRVEKKKNATRIALWLQYKPVGERSSKI